MESVGFGEYIVFVDESGDHSLTSINDEYPVFVLCFCVVKKEAYCNEIVPKVQRLKLDFFGHDQVVIHEHDIRKRKHAFERLNKEARAEFMDRLSLIMEEAELEIIAVVIDKIRHKAKYSSPDHPYHLALKFGLERLYDLLKLQGQTNGLTHVVVEKRGNKEDSELELEFRRVVDGGNRGRVRLPFEIVFAHKQSNSSGLQLADITARPLGLSVIRPDQENRAMNVIKKKLYTGRYNCISGNGLKVFP